MKNLKVLVLLLSVFALSSCLKSGDNYDSEAQIALEKPIIKTYVDQNLPTATLHESTNIWFHVLDAGDPESYEYKTIGVGGPIESPIIRVKYTVHLLNGTKVDETTKEEGYENSLGNLIRAWHIAFLPNKINGNPVNGLTETGLKKGAKIRFVTPSFWAYQNNAYGNIPANSPLDFYIEVLDIKSPSDTPGAQ